MVDCNNNPRHNTSNNCQECQWNRNLSQLDCTLCYNNATSKFRLNEIGQCVPTSCNENQYFVNNSCQACGSICNQCENPQTCLNC